jgi:hypothetical protein
MSDVPRVTYVAHPDTAAESELQTLAAVYAFILERQTERKTGESSSDEDAETKLRLHEERRPPCEVDN